MKNIIYILSDEHRGQAMSHAGDPNVKTPNMDRLAREGVSFTSACANCPICTPSRGTIFSGRHAHAGPIQGFFDVYKTSAPSIATHLRGQGYHTAYIGKWHLGQVRDQIPPLVREHPGEYLGNCQRTPERHRAGFQDWFGFENLNQHFASYYYKGSDINPTKVEGYETDGLTNLAIEYISQYERKEPLFLTLSVTPPHFPLVAPEEWKRFDPATLELRPNVRAEDEPEMRECLANYYAMIENLDYNIGRLLKTIRETPGFEDTLVVYFSDHGDLMGSHGLQSRKEFPCEEAVRIPAIFHDPTCIPAQGTRDELFSLVDLLATTCGAAGLPVPAYSQGRDFSPALRGEPFEGPEDVLLEMVANPRWDLSFIDWRAIRTREWKYAYYESGHEELFNLARDPYELEDVAASEPAQRAHMRLLLLTRLRETREPYYDVIMEHGANLNAPDVDVSQGEDGHPGM